MAADTTSSSHEISLLFHIEFENKHRFPKKAIVKLIQDATVQMGVTLSLDLPTNSLLVTLKNYEVFQTFFEIACINLPLSPSPTEKVFEIQFTFNHIPRSIHEADLIAYLYHRCEIMNIGLNPISGTGVYKMLFPSEDMYKLAVVGMVERFYQWNVPS